jgi:hypothetical protein
VIALPEWVIGIGRNGRSAWPEYAFKYNGVTSHWFHYLDVNMKILSAGRFYPPA